MFVTAELMHDLKMPLQLICSCAQMVQCQLKGREPEAERYIGMLMENAMEMQRMLLNVVDFERLNNGMVQLVALPGNMTSCVKEICRRVLPMAENAGIRLTWDVPEDSIGMLFDAEKIHRILLNLLSNAVRFTPQGGEIQVRLLQMERSVRIVVSDNGCGIAPEVLEHIFERGVSKGGTGYGLFIALEFARLHGGTLTVRSEVGAGTTFFLDLPKKPEFYQS